MKERRPGNPTLYIARGNVSGLERGTPPIERGVWPPQFFKALLVPVAQWAEQHPTRYHHTGFTFPTRAAFVAATTGLELISNDLITPKAVHHRRYLRVPSGNGQDTYIEYHMVGDEGNGVQGVHFDFITDKPEGMLEFVASSLDTDALGGARIVTQSFGGGNAPVGKVGLQPFENPTLEVGVMSRTHWSDPSDW